MTGEHVKRSIVPNASDKFLFNFAPVLVIVVAMLLLAVILVPAATANNKVRIGGDVVVDEGLVGQRGHCGLLGGDVRAQFHLPVVARGIGIGFDTGTRTQGGHCFGHPARLVIIHRERSALPNCAETAAPGADIAENHERRRAVVPALTDIRASGALADRMEPQAVHKRFQAAVVAAHRRGGAQPEGAVR